MALDGYEGNRELVMKKETQEVFQQGFDKLRETMMRYGFSAGAVGQIEFRASEHMLEISDEEARSGAFHIHAGGKPFYALTLEAPGSMMELGTGGGDTNKPLSLDDRQQSLLLGFEIGMNLMGRVGDVLRDVYGLKGDNLAGGVSGEIMRCKMETTMRCDPATYMAALNQLLDYRLKMLVPDPADQDLTSLRRDVKAMKPMNFGGPK
jgi:hypothetical protein